MNQTIGEMPKNALEKVVATLAEYKGRPRIDIRVFWQPEVTEPDNWVATRKGINLSPDHWQDFKELINKLDKAIGKTA
jgi:hypothetical protein